MNVLDQKKLLATRIIAYLNPVPANAVQTLLQKSLPDLEALLDQLATQKAQGDSEEEVIAYREDSRREAAFESAYVHGLLQISLSGKRLVDCESNKNMLESLLNPGELPSVAIYQTLALQFASRFSWEVPPAAKTAADREAEFVKVCHENQLSICDANRQMFKDGVALDAWAGASGLERAAFQAQAAQERQTFLIKNASPQQLKEEARFQSATEREIALKAESDRQHAFVSQQQVGLYSILPTHNEAGEVLDARYFRRISTLDYALFKKLCKKFGTSQITERLRTPAAPTVKFTEPTQNQ
jgi:hypothetical protein